MKVCPLAAADPEQKNSNCLGEVCACFVKMQKHHITQTGKNALVDHERFYRYHGCGLVAHIPWELVDFEKPPKSNK